MADSKNGSDLQESTLKVKYFAVWKSLFGQFLQWPEDRVFNWAKRFSQMDDADSLFYHHSALWYAVPWLTPRSISQLRKGLHLFEFHGNVERAILGDEPQDEMSPTFDWAAARQRLNNLLLRTGESLENVKRELDEQHVGL